MAIEHTEGPWEWEVREITEDAYMEMALLGRDGDGVAYHSAVWPVADANARLIAAAPEMYDVLRWLDRKGGLGLDVHARITAVLAKAAHAGRDEA